MIGVYLNPLDTQIVQAKLKRNNRLKVETCAVFESYWESLNLGDVNYLIAMFSRIKQSVHSLYEEFYVVLPDSIFLLIDCMDVHGDDEEERIAAIETRLGRKCDEFYTSFPLSLQGSTRHKETSIVIDRRIIDALIAAAQATHITLISVEPASMAYLRSTMQWRKEYYLLESFANEASLIAFSPIAGMFRLSVPELALSSCDTDDAEAWNRAVISVLSRCDAIANLTFGINNTDTAVTLFADGEASTVIRQITEQLHRAAEQAGFPEFVDSELDKSAQQKFSIPLGGLMQALNSDDIYLYATVPDKLQVHSANVLPQHVRMESHLEQVKRVTKKYSKVLCGVLSGCIALQIAGILYFNSIVIPDALQSDYDQAQSQMESVKRETELIKLAKLEHQYPIEALVGLVGSKPQNLGFSSVEIGRKGTTTSKEQDKKWISFVAKSNDPMVFRDYATQLGDNSLFRGVTISQISTETSGLKSATVFIGKGLVR